MVRCAPTHDSTEIKKANILHHNVEAAFFEIIHSEGSNLYERSKTAKDIRFILDISKERSLCLDIGCGTGFITGFELSRCKDVLAIDISRQMLEVVRRRFKNFRGLNLLLCDAENLPLRSRIANVVSVSSVLHHLPKPSRSIVEVSRALKANGFLYITREPNDARFRCLFDFLDEVVIRKLVGFMSHLMFLGKRKKRSSIVEEIARTEGLNYQVVDVHCATGFNVEGLSIFLSQNDFKVVSACSYHWTFFDVGFRINCVAEKIPLARKFGRYISLISRKLPSPTYFDSTGKRRLKQIVAPPLVEKDDSQKVVATV